ncbi:unnamed protein product, partial [Cladocopium goreaui]
MLGTCCGDMAILPGSKTRSGYMLMETSMAVERVERIERQAEDQSTRSFHWLGRECYGSPLHVAALNGDFDEVQKILQETPHQINSRFTYFSSWGEKKQEGSGEAIHLAASRREEKVLRLLVSLGAKISSKVTRGGENNYDVLHAAVYAEGKGGSSSMVSYLLEMKADPRELNANGFSTLHLAHQTGSVDLIKLLYKAIPNWPEFEDSCANDDRAGLPLEIGIHFDKMSEIELAETAPLTRRSLKLLIYQLPRCIPKFLQRMGADALNDIDLSEDGGDGEDGREDGRMDGKSIARFIEPEDIARLMRECPEAACALLDYCSLKPKVMSGHNPLPTRVSFAPRTWTQGLQKSLNLQNDLLVFHKEAEVWEYDTSNFTMPEWHSAITERKTPYNRKNHKEIVRDERRRRRMARRDAEIKVCHVPNLLTAEYFQAIIDASEADPAYARFDNDVVRSSIHYAFWHGACMYDVFQVAMSFWAVLILVFETCMLVFEEDVHVRDSRRLHPGSTWQAPKGEDLTDGGGCLLCDLHVATSWIAAKGLVDFLMEVLQFLGCYTMGQPTSYFTLGNIFDVFRSVAQQMLFWHPGRKIVNVVVIFCLWLRLLEVFSTAEKVARAILPIRDLAKGLAPALVVFSVGYFAFAHALFAIRDSNQPVWGQVFHDSFLTLITASIPEDSTHVSMDELCLCYLAVLMFSIFFLNIFIGVIGELYESEKGRSGLTFQELRAQSVLSFQLRAQILPSALCNATLAQVMASIIFCIIVGIQLFCVVTRWRLPHCEMIFTFLQLAMIVCVFQRPDEDWRSRDKGSVNKYLWICKPAPDGDEEA